MQNIVGKTVKSASYSWKYDKIEIVFTDDTKLVVKEVGYSGELEVRINNQAIEDEEEGKDNGLYDDENADPFFDDFHEDNHKY